MTTNKGGGANAVPEQRTSLRFSWSMVDSRLRRALLEAVYISEHDDLNLERLRRASQAALEANAKRVFGRPLGDKHMVTIAPVLLKRWVPHLPKDEAIALARAVQAGLAPPDRHAALHTKAQAVAFVQRRRLTKNFLVRLRKKFVASHRAPEQVPARPGTTGQAAGPSAVDGLGEPPRYAPYPHQTAARAALTKALTSSASPGHALVVLPTGAGKTETLVEWLLEGMAAEPALRVLWIAHQQELLDQAAERFRRCARSRPRSFQRRLRTIHSAGSAISTLRDPDLDIAAVTIQTLSRNLARDRGKAATLQTFLHRPTVVVIDEAHHAGSPSYTEVLDELQRHDNLRAVVGLTATPVPTSLTGQWAIRERFGTPVYEARPGGLIAQQILARPIVHTVTTGLTVTLDAEEVNVASRADLLPRTLDRLDNPLRNRLVRDTYAAHTAEWGKTLVFAASITHADELATELTEVAPTKVMHSDMSEPRAAVLEWFRDAREPSILVSVGMLTEGVDLPDATTAFLCRPTTSRVLLRQMVGRVLRGPRAGGTAEAHVVDFRDRWTNFGDVLEPMEVLAGAQPTHRAREGEEEHHLPDVVDENGTVIPLDVVAAVERIYETAAEGRAPTGELDEDADAPIDPVLVSARLAGYWELADAKVPAFHHQLEGFRALLDDAVKGSLKGTAFLSYFDDSHPPYPTRRMLQDLVAHTREYGTGPAFIDFDAIVGPGAAADRVLAASAIDDRQRALIIEQAYEGSLSRAAYPSFDRFEEAVEQELRQRRSARTRLEPERMIPPSPSGRRLLPRADRSLKPAEALVKELAADLLPPDIYRRWGYWPTPEWTKRVVATTWGHWSLTLQGKAAGQQRIRINRLLRAPADQVSEEALGYLLYHEVLHSLLPGQGHDAEFRELEARWPNAGQLDYWFDTLHEHWETRPERYEA